jgi:hypothetical protein
MDVGLGLTYKQGTYIGRPVPLVLYACSDKATKISQLYNRYVMAAFDIWIG